jgi:hypothetical protein
VSCPTGGIALIDGVFDIQPGASLDQEADHCIVAGQGGLMQRRRMSVVSFGIEAIGIFARIE